MKTQAANHHDALNTRSTLKCALGPVTYYRLDALTQQGFSGIDRLPITIKLILENLLRACARDQITEDDVIALANWTPPHSLSQKREYYYFPSRVILQDFTGVAVLTDIAAMRSAVERLGSDPKRVHPLLPLDLVVDHSIQVDEFGTPRAYQTNMKREFERNRERYLLLRWAQKVFNNVRIIPPGGGIIHQINLEFLASVVATIQEQGETIAFPDTVIGTDSHTPMINGLGVLGWGVGGIEAEAALLGQPLSLLTPEVIGIRLTGTLPEGTTATDLVLTITQVLRKYGVVGKFVEFTGSGLLQLPLTDRATIANMAPEFGATAALFPVDQETLQFLQETGRSSALIDLVERYTKSQGLFYSERTPEPLFQEMLTLDLSSIEPCVAGPSRPQDRVPLYDLPQRFQESYPTYLTRSVPPLEKDEPDPNALTHGSVVIAAITSCTNTSNPSVMIAAGLVAKRAFERGLRVKQAVKTSLAPGSRTVIDYLTRAQLLPYLAELGFHLVGFGCTTCSGSSGPLPDKIEETIRKQDLIVASVLSGNRNFEGRIHPLVRASFLAAPPLVIAYALAGTINIDLTQEPLGLDKDGIPVYLRDIWPKPAEIQAIMRATITPTMFTQSYQSIYDGDEQWQALPYIESALFNWDTQSTYIQEPPFLQHVALEMEPITPIRGARVLVFLGDSITTDHISPAGNIPIESPAGLYLSNHSVAKHNFNTYGARRGNHEVMVRGTFGNIRLRNRLVASKEGYYTQYLPDGEEMPIYEAAIRYQQKKTPLLVLAGKEYGTGSSRDWAAKGPALLGIRAVIAESFERIHRTNLIGMGILPLQFKPGEGALTLGLTGREEYEICNLSSMMQPEQELQVKVVHPDGTLHHFTAIARLDSQLEIMYYRQGGILPAMLRKLV